VRWLRLSIATDPLQEHVWRQLLRALAAVGNYAAVMQTYRELRTLLRREMNTDVDRQTAALYDALSRESRARQRSGRGPTARAVRHDQPRVERGERALARVPQPLTELVGREADVKQVVAAVWSRRLTTLTGAGGVGKSRLAIHVAAELAEHFADGVCFADLAPLTDPTLVVPTIASALGIREESRRSLTDVMLEHLRDRETLLVLDNCEHLLESCASLAERILTACRSMRILATSRQSLGITGEVTWRVPSLAVPDVADMRGGSAAAMQRYASVRLFLERAHQAHPEFDPPPEMLPMIAQVCRRLDGIPLAIELAAVRAKVLTVAELAARLDDRFRLLTAGSRTALPRHQTLQATMDWSYHLLGRPEQTVLRRLAVFAGGFTLPAAETIVSECGIRAEAVLDLVARLVDKSLVFFDERVAPRRYRLLETVRQYARERLEESGELARVRDRHRDYFVTLAEQAEPFIFGGVSDRTWLGRLEEELDNLRSAFEWSGQHPAGGEAGLRLAAAIHWFWFASGRFREGRERTTAALARGADAVPLARARTLTASALIAFWQGDIGSMEAPLEEALAIVRDSGDTWSIAYTLCVRGTAANFRGDPRAARALFEEAITIARTQPRRILVPFVLWWLGLVAQSQGDYAAARLAFEEGLAVGRQERWAPAVAHVGYMLGRLHLALGDYKSADSHYRESLRLLQQLDDRWGIANVLDGLARLAAFQDQPERAARLVGASAALRDALGASLLLPDQDESARAFAVVGAALRQERFEALQDEGRGMPLDQMIQNALGE
jgi:predicted ATPase